MAADDLFIQRSPSFYNNSHFHPDWTTLVNNQSIRNIIIDKSKFFLNISTFLHIAIHIIFVILK